MHLCLRLHVVFSVLVIEVLQIVDCCRGLVDRLFGPCGRLDLLNVYERQRGNLFCLEMTLCRYVMEILNGLERLIILYFEAAFWIQFN